MIELDKYELDILHRLIYPETLKTLLEESMADEYILSDCLRSLTQKKLISPVVKDEKSGRFKRVFIYDSDHLEKYSFQITSKGLEYSGK